MSLNNEFAGKRVLVVGLAATGLATARVLRDLGATVTVADARPAESLSPERLREVRALEGVLLAPGLAEPDLGAVDLVVPSPGVPRSAPVLQRALAAGVPILSEIETAYRIARAPILAITGTNGKTTTTALLGAICRTAGLRTWVAGNIAEDAGVRQPLIEAAVQAPADGVIVAEISSFQLEWVDTFRPQVGAWLNLSADHLDRYADLDEYADAKANLFRAQRDGDTAVLNAEDPIVIAASEGAGAGKRILFGLSRHAFPMDDPGPRVWLDGSNVVAENVVPSLPSLHVLSRHDIVLPGLHNVANVLAAAAMALAFGIDVGSIRAAVRGFHGVPHRMEYIDTVNGVRFVNNSMCTNPAAVLASLQAVEGPVVAIVGGEHKGGDLKALVMGLSTHARHVILIGVSANLIADALGRSGNPPQIDFAATLPEAVNQAADLARVGDTVLLVPGCASFDMFAGFEHRGQVFRDAVRGLSGER